MKTQNYLKWAGILLLSFFVVMSSCKKDDNNDTNNNNNNNSNTTVTQDKDAISASTTKASDDVNDLFYSEGLTTVSEFAKYLEMDNTFFGKKERRFNADLFLKIKGLFVNRHNVQFTVNKTNGGVFDFNNKTGTYTWNCTTERWDIQTGVPAGKVVIIFPSDSGSCTNNATITINDYKETYYIDEWDDGYGNIEYDTIYLPTRIDGNIKVDGIEQVSVDYTGTWNNDGIPQTVNLTLFVNPFTLKANLNNQTTTISGSVSLTKAGEGTIAAIGGTINFVDATQEQVKDIKNAYVQYRNIKVKANNVDVLSLENLSCNTSTECVNYYNQYADLELWYDSGAKIGDIEFYVNSLDEEDVRIVFKDGTTVPASDYIDPLLDDIETALNDL